MSEQNILNPTQSDPLNPDYGWSEAPLSSSADWQAASGEYFTRDIASRGLTRDLTWSNQLQTTADALRQWWAQYRNGFFTLADYERARYYSGRLAGKPEISPAGFDRVNIKAQFMELPKVAMYQYPTNWARDAVFLEERDDFGNDLVKLTGGWTWESGVAPSYAHGTSCYLTNNLNATAEWKYFGYGFRLWARKEPLAGIVAVSVDGGVETNIDLYQSPFYIAQVVYTNANLSLGMHRVKIRNTGTKNAASGGVYVFADAIEVMQ